MKKATMTYTNFNLGLFIFCFKRETHLDNQTGWVGTANGGRLTVLPF